MKAGKYLAAAGAAVLLALSGCGGGDGGATAETTSSLSKAEFMKKATAICARGTAKINAGYSRASAEATKRGAGEHFMNEAAARIVIPVRREQLQEIKALGLPAEDEETIEAFLEALQEGIERGEESHASLRAGGPDFAFERAYVLANKHGLESCFFG